MAELITPENLQKIEFDVTTSEGDSRVTIVSGRMPIQLICSGSSNVSVTTQRSSFKVLLDPTLQPGKFRKATAIASLAEIVHAQQTLPGQFWWDIEDVEATLDDEEGRVQLVVDLRLVCLGADNSIIARGIEFQVTTVAIF